MNIKSLCAIVVLLWGFQVLAADIAREVQNTRYGQGSIAELGVSFSTVVEPLIGFNGLSLEESGDPDNSLNLTFEGRFEYKSAFIEVIENSFSNISLGFDAYSSSNSNHEVLITSLFSDVKRNDVTGFESIETRKGDLNAGLRSSYYFGKNIVQLALLGDVYNSHNGIIASLQLGRQTQVRNWNLYSALGIRYFSDSVVNHYFGISPAEASAELPAYEADYGLMPSLQLGATLPLSEKWIFKVTAEYTRLPSSVSDSPLAQGDSIYSAAVGVSYVLHGS